MAVQNPTALVVDDDVLSRRVVTMALEKEGFSCAQAVDGEDALTQLSARMFDLVVTDLRMPKINGHELSTELLTWTNRPIIVAHTGVDDLRLAKDLLARGVDDIIYKPANYEALAAKFKALVDRRKKTQLEGSSTNSSVQHNFLVGDSTNQSSLRNKVSMAEFESRLATVWQKLPISRSAFELLDQTRKEEATVLTIAGIIQRDAALTAEVLRLANSAFYKTNTRAILDVEEAVSRIGMRRLSELAVAMSAMGALSKSVVPWLDTELASQRSLAGGIAVSRLLDAMGRQEIEDGIVLAAVMYPLGRVILGTLFPTLYEQMLATSRRTQIALRQLEREVFPEPHSAATARVLAHWALPQEVYGPLAYTAQNFDYLPQLNEPTRSNVTLIKTGILLGQIAVGRWLQGDLIDLPSSSLLSGLGVDSFNEIVEQLRCDLNAVTPNGSQSRSKQESPSPPKAKNSQYRKIRYCNMSTDSVDFVRLLLTSMGFNIEDVPSDADNLSGPLVVNCTHASAKRLAAVHVPAEAHPWVIVADNELPADFNICGGIVRLPASCAALRTACERAVLS